MANRGRVPSDYQGNEAAVEDDEDGEVAEAETPSHEGRNVTQKQLQDMQNGVTGFIKRSFTEAMKELSGAVETVASASSSSAGPVAPAGHGLPFGVQRTVDAVLPDDAGVVKLSTSQILNVKETVERIEASALNMQSHVVTCVEAISQEMARLAAAKVSLQALMDRASPQNVAKVQVVTAVKRT